MLCPQGALYENGNGHLKEREQKSAEEGKILKLNNQKKLPSLSAPSLPSLLCHWKVLHFKHLQQER